MGKEDAGKKWGKRSPKCREKRNKKRSERPIAE